MVLLLLLLLLLRLLPLLLLLMIAVLTLHSRRGVVETHPPRLHLPAHRPTDQSGIALIVTKVGPEDFGLEVIIRATVHDGRLIVRSHVEVLVSNCVRPVGSPEAYLDIFRRGRRCTKDRS